MRFLRRIGLLVAFLCVVSGFVCGFLLLELVRQGAAPGSISAYSGLAFLGGVMVFALGTATMVMARRKLEKPLLPPDHRQDQDLFAVGPVPEDLVDPSLKVFPDVTELTSNQRAAEVSQQTAQVTEEIIQSINSFAPLNKPPGQTRK